MNEGDSAGGGHQGQASPAPPAVLDRRSIVSSNSNPQLYNQGIQQSQTVTSGSAVSSTTINILSQQQQNQQLQHMSSRYLSNERIGNLTNQQQQQQQHQQTNNNQNLNINSTGVLASNRPSNSNTATSSYTISTTRSSNINYINNSGVAYQTSSPIVVVSTSSQSTPGIQSQVTDNTNLLVLTNRKRLKLDPCVSLSTTSISTTTTTTTTVIGSGTTIAGGCDINGLKKRILEHKYSRLKSLKERYTENVAELFFLQSGGNMMEYPVWRKKPPTPQFINFTKNYRLDGNVNEEANKTQTPSQVTSTATTPTSLPQGTEIKIPSVGATPVAVSTTLPAAVVQLTQQGHIPGRPQGGRHGMVFGQIPVPHNVGNSPVPLVPGGTPLVPDIPSSIGGNISDKRKTPNATNVVSTSPYAQTPNPSNGIQEQFSVKAKQEVYVMQRISELQREGLWAEKRLPKLQEPTRPKAHWDYLLEEMVWLAADFAQERKWKKAAAKKCARMVQKHFTDKANAAQKAEKAQELHLKRVAAFIAKEIKVFWSNVEKLVEFKHQTKLEEKRKKALDQHLSFIVDQTEKFSQQLAEGMNKSVADNSAVPSLNSSRISSPKRENASDDEFQPECEASDDDEETIAKEEAQAEAMDVMNVSDEIAALERESQMDLDDFLNELPKDYLENRDKIILANKESDSEDPSDKDFEADENSGDDEATIMQQEKNEKNVDYKKEVDELNADNEMSLDELLAIYKKGGKPVRIEEEKMDLDSDDDDDDDAETADSEEEESDEGIAEDEQMSDNEAAKSELDSNVGLRSLLVEEDKSSQQSDKDNLINDAAALAESIQPKGNTLSSTNVVTPVPFLLKHTLREYQHIGLDWLVTMHDRKLNGILADEMGLGKTIQTIALLAHLACVKANWGPHLIVVPSSVMLNWEMEFKKWCPAFKILTYYGTQKERKQKRIGWTKPNAFHICITSYKLVIQDQQSFRRKKWKYLILDEAQNIKNFKSQRWQLLLNFQTEQRLLLTGTPLQNNLMELWSLMHFLMPHVFQSHREFKEWFSNPMTGMIEGNSEYNDSIIKRLHKVLRPFLLRRLKSEVEKQMPKKYEHVVMCRLSKRQRYLYDDFMSRAKTRETLATGNLLSVINVLMQLRKVCNHPNLFEVRPIISPFQMEGIGIHTASMICNILDYDPFTHIDLNSLNLALIQLEMCLSAYVSYKIRKLSAPRKLIEEIQTLPEEPPKCPSGMFKFKIRIKDSRVHENLISHSGVKVGTSPAMKTEGNKLVPVINIDKKYSSINQCKNKFALISMNKNPILTTSGVNHGIIKRNIDGNNSRSTTTTTQTATTTFTGLTTTGGGGLLGQQPLQILQTTTGRHIVLTPTTSGTILTGNQRFIFTKGHNSFHAKIVGKPAAQTTVMPSICPPIENQNNLVLTLAQQLKVNPSSQTKPVIKEEKKTFDAEQFFAEREQMKKDRKQNILKFLSSINQRKCDSIPMYGEDCRESMKNFGKPSKSIKFSSWHSRSYTNCLSAMNRNENWSLKNLLLSNERRTEEMKALIENFVLWVPPVSAPCPHLHVSHPKPFKMNEEKNRECTIQHELSPKFSLLHPIISAMCTQFPDPRLIQYDCGKLQTLDRLLRKLKSDGHRVLIFTQMTKMLDVLEAFLNYHGHIYLRLDGTTRIEQRQILMERFNKDKRLFAFILSTRSGGVGVNLTGADTVIFYDSDWNPTMDAQAQDRCHRIGQTRDVHIYRLVSEKTIEENILKKANQKRLLGDLAIEGGNFTTAYFKSSTIQDLFQVEAEEDASMRLAEVLDRDRERKIRLQDNLQAIPNVTSNIEEKSTLGAFESALAAAEDEQDVQAAKIAKAEAAADLAEFDENIPLEDAEKQPEVSKADQEVANLVKQLSPIERYAMRFVEETGGSWTAEQLRQAEAEIEQQKREWEANRVAALQKEEEQRQLEKLNDEMLTYSREDAQKQIWISDNTLEKMPMWCPPTPPQNDNDIYIDYSLSFMYESEIMPESHLPPIYVKKEYKRTRTDAGYFMECRRPPKIRKEDNYYAPRSLFDRPSPGLAKIRRDLKLQRYRGVFKPNVQIPGFKQQMMMKPLVEPEGMAEWCIYEDIAILHALQNLQGLPLNLMLLSPGHTPNWDLVAEIVSLFSRTIRSPKQCRWRYEAVIVPREEGKLLESPKKQKKLKTTMKASIKGGVKSLRTSQLFTSDNNNAFTRLMKLKYDNIKGAYLKKAPPPKQVLGVTCQKNLKHVAVLNEFGITNYDTPLTPAEIAVRKADKIKDKHRSGVSLAPPGQQQSSEVNQQSQQQQQQQQQQQMSVTQQATAIVVQQSPQVQQQQVQQVTQIMQAGGSLQSRSASQGGPITVHSQGAQIVKAIVTPSSGIVGQVQHLSQQNTQQVQLQQQSTIQQAVNIVNQPSVSVVLTTPVSTMSNVQQQTQGAQIVSLHQQSNNSGSSIATQAQTATIVQTIPSQSLPQVVSVSQLATVGTVLTTSATLQPNATVATLNASGLRAQRLVAAPGTLQEVVLQQRANSQSPIIVSNSGLGQGVTQGQFPTAQLRLSMAGGQQVSGVVTKGISVSSLQQAGKLTANQPAQIQLYRQQAAIRQQLKVLQTSAGQGGGTAVVQTAGGQTALVNATGTIIQGGIVPTGQTVQVQGQKVSVATVSAANVVAGSSGVVTSVATVQVAPGQGRTQFIKQVGVAGKQTITRQVTESEMLLVKRQLIGQQKTQVIPPTQIFAPANVQVQQAGSSGQQQIATLVKTSSGTVATTGGAVGMALSQIKPGGQIKVTMANQSQVRQLQLQQQLALAQQRKVGKMAQIAQVTGKGVPAQLIVQNPKNLPGSMTVQQIQQVIRHAQPISTGGQIVLGKTSVGRVIPVSVASQANARQTIQVVSASSAQALAAGNIRAHVAGAQNIAGTIKVPAGATPVQTQQALITALQSQQNQRQNASPVRLQTTSGGSLVAVTVQQQPSTATVVTSNTTTTDVTSIGQQTTQQQTKQTQGQNYF